MNTNRDLSTEAQSAKVDRLDDAIDAVAARLTHVDDDPAMVSHIVNALPERATWFGWLFHAWAPRLATIAIVVAAGIVWGNRRAVVIAPIVSVQPITTLTVFVASVREAEPNRTTPLKRLERLEPLEPLVRADFERSLDAIAAPESLVLRALAPDALPASESLVLEPLAIADLPLTAEPISPR